MIEVLAVAISPDGHTLLTGSKDKTARLWNAFTGLPMGPPLVHGLEVLSRLHSSPDGHTLLTGSFGSLPARLWNVATGKLIGLPLEHGDEG